MASQTGVAHVTDMIEIDLIGSAVIGTAIIAFGVSVGWAAYVAIPILFGKKK